MANFYGSAIQVMRCQEHTAKISDYPACCRLAVARWPYLDTTTVMSITGDPLRDTPGDRARGPEESFRRHLVALLTEPNVDEIAITVNGAVEVDRAPFHFNERFAVTVQRGSGRLS
jgi:hypothetical protein